MLTYPVLQLLFNCYFIVNNATHFLFVCVWADCHFCPGEPALDDYPAGDGEAQAYFRECRSDRHVTPGDSVQIRIVLLFDWITVMMNGHVYQAGFIWIYVYVLCDYFVMSRCM